MSGAKSNRTYIAATKEDVWGVLNDPLDLQKINFSSESLAYEVDSTVPDTIRDDRMISDVIIKSTASTGGFESEMQALFSGANDDLILGALWAQSWNTVKGDTTEFIDAQNAVIVQATKTLDMTAAAHIGAMTVGQKFRIQGSALQNDGIYTVATTNGAGVYTTVEAFAADETLPASSTVSGAYAANGVYRNSFTIERGHTDIAQYFLFLGMVVNEWTISFEAGEIVTSSFSFMGKNTILAQAPYGGSYIPAPTTAIMSTGYNVSDVLIDGVPVPSCVLMGIELGINNNVRGKLGVGELSYCDVADGEFGLGGNVSMYFNDETMYERLLNNTAFGISFQLSDNAGNIYLIELPRVKLSADPINVSGKNTDIMDAAEYFAIVSPTLGCMIRISRFLASYA